MDKITYKNAGVDLDVYRESMSRLPGLMSRTFSPRVRRLDSGFAGLFQLDFGNPLFSRRYEVPLLVAGTDGVGTKLKIAGLANTHDSVGIDLVAMCVNDVICCGAEPLFFLDYVAMPEDAPDVLERIVAGISEGCLRADCALLGGETAIMPDLYSRGDYDLAGFAVGVVEEKQLIDGKKITPGDTVLGVASSGLHSNGFSLVRKLVFDIAGLAIDDEVPGMTGTVASTLLTPTQIYARGVRAVFRHYAVKSVVRGIAHITGGGMLENVQRILPSHVDVRISRSSWEVPPVFTWLQGLGDVENEEMWRVFNMGIGLVLIVSSFHANAIRRILEKHQLVSWRVGEVVEGSGKTAWAD